MNHYPHHIGDFNAATRHLTRIERSLYRDAIEMYYDKEGPLESDFDRLSKRLLATTAEELDSLAFVLNEFFTLVGDEYINDRCEEELLNYRNNISFKSKAGIASAAARKIRAKERRGLSDDNSTGVQQVLNSSSTDVQQTGNRSSTEGQQNPTNHEPSTINHEPLSIKASPSAQFDFKSAVIGMGVDEETVIEWLRVRAKKRATNSKIALDGTMAQIYKAGLTPQQGITIAVERSWSAFNASWIDKKSEGGGNVSAAVDWALQ